MEVRRGTHHVHAKLRPCRCGELPRSNCNQPRPRPRTIARMRRTRSNPRNTGFEAESDVAQGTCLLTTQLWTGTSSLRPPPGHGAYAIVCWLGLTNVSRLFQARLDGLTIPQKLRATAHLSTRKIRVNQMRTSVGSPRTRPPFQNRSSVIAWVVVGREVRHELLRPLRIAGTGT